MPRSDPAPSAASVEPSSASARAACVGVPAAGGGTTRSEPAPGDCDLIAPPTAHPHPLLMKRRVVITPHRARPARPPKATKGGLPQSDAALKGPAA